MLVTTAIRTSPPSSFCVSPLVKVIQPVTDLLFHYCYHIIIIIEIV